MHRMETMSFEWRWKLRKKWTKDSKNVGTSLTGSSTWSRGFGVLMDLNVFRLCLNMHRASTGISQDLTQPTQTIRQQNLLTLGNFPMDNINHPTNPQPNVRIWWYYTVIWWSTHLMAGEGCKEMRKLRVIGPNIAAEMSIIMGRSGLLLRWWCCR